MIAITGAASNFRRRAAYQRHDRMIRQPAALDAKIVNDVAQAQVGVHWLRVYQYTKYTSAPRRPERSEGSPFAVNFSNGATAGRTVPQWFGGIAPRRSLVRPGKVNLVNVH